MVTAITNQNLGILKLKPCLEPPPFENAFTDNSNQKSAASNNFADAFSGSQENPNSAISNNFENAFGDSQAQNSVASNNFADAFSEKPATNTNSQPSNNLKSSIQSEKVDSNPTEPKSDPWGFDNSDAFNSQAISNNNNNNDNEISPDDPFNDNNFGIENNEWTTADPFAENPNDDPFSEDPFADNEANQNLNNRNASPIKPAYDADILLNTSNPTAAKEESILDLVSKASANQNSQKTDLDQPENLTVNSQSEPSQIEISKIPSTHIKITHEAKFQFDARTDDELTIMPGDLICVPNPNLEGLDEGWYFGSLVSDTAKQGMFPKDFVVEYTEQAATPLGNVSSPNPPSDQVAEQPQKSSGGFEVNFDDPFNDKAPAAISNSMVNGFDAFGESNQAEAGGFGDNSFGDSQNPSQAAPTASGFEAFGQNDNFGSQATTAAGFGNDPFASQDSAFSKPATQTDTFVPNSSEFANSITTLTNSMNTLTIQNTQADRISQSSSDLNRCKSPVKRRAPNPPGVSSDNSTSNTVQYIADYQYHGNQPNDLSFEAGQIILVEQMEGDWWIGRIGNKRGHFPANFVSKLQDSEQNSGINQPSLYQKNSYDSTSQTSQTLNPTTSQNPSQSQSQNPTSDSDNYLFKVQANYDFVGENDGDLGFVYGDVIKVIKKLDDDWHYGELNGKYGIFPCIYVSPIG